MQTPRWVISYTATKRHALRTPIAKLRKLLKKPFEFACFRTNSKMKGMHIARLLVRDGRGLRFTWLISER